MEQASLRTLVFVTTPDQILLGFKKRGFGAGKWNGFGGKALAGETLSQTARRELAEEAGIVAQDLTQCGRLSFTFGNGVAPLLVHVFYVLAWAGEVRESEEMAPRWFSQAAIPYEAMWVDDRYWLPLVLARKCFIGAFHFFDTETILTWEVNEVAAERLSRHV